MIKMTEEMRDLIDNAIVNGTPCIWEQVLARVVQPELDRDPERQGIAVVIRVNKILAGNGDVLQQREA